MQPYYQDGSVTLYLGDCLDVLPDLTGVDMVFTSPPYNLGGMSARGPGKYTNLRGGYRTYTDQLPPDEYEMWQQEVLTLCWETLTEVGAIFYNHKPIIRDGSATLPTRLNPGLPLRQILIWYRQMGVNWSTSHFLTVHEWILLFAKPAWHLRDRSASHVSDVWVARPDMTDAEHPAPFPVSLPARAIEAAAPRVVLDPFAGSGTTLRAAKDAGASSIGIEIDERYCEIAAKRLEQEAFVFEEDPPTRNAPALWEDNT